jgi:SAM-dependent methyltransferase
MSRPRPFSPASYWEARYREGRDSGEGSRGETGRAKAAFVNDVIARYSVASMIDWGCGDGQVLAHITEDVGYLGVDVSATILAKIRAEHPGRMFCHADQAREPLTMLGESLADMALSMDVLFHFPADRDYFAYLHDVFASAQDLVLIYATDYDGGQTARHVRRRHFTPDIAARFPAWRLIEQQPGPGPQATGFFLYRKEG